MIINIIGAGFAGVEAAYFLAKKGCKVNLYEMRDKKMTPAHKTAFFAEPVCSNSFKSTALDNAHGLLKKELEELDSIIIKCACQEKIPAGGALAVDRERFASRVTQELGEIENINIIRDEVRSFDEFIKKNEPLIISSGPLTSPKLSEAVQKLIGKDFLFFFDAAAPIIDAESIDYSKAFFQSRYDRGGSDYLNCSLNREEYYRLVEEIKNAEKTELHDFEKKRVFEGCMPVEALAERGIETLAFGPMKPVGITDPNTGRRAYAVLQLRQENTGKSMYNMVGFQTRLKWSEQKRVFRMIPGLENAEFLRYGVMHKNTFLNYPEIINVGNYSLKNHDNIYFAGQITGVEGYIESAASGIYTAYSLWAALNNREIYLPSDTMSGSLQHYTTIKNKNYQPMASNFGLFGEVAVQDEKGKKLKGRDKKLKLSENALDSLNNFISRNL